MKDFQIFVVWFVAFTSGAVKGEENRMREVTVKYRPLPPLVDTDQGVLQEILTAENLQALVLELQKQVLLLHNKQQEDREKIKNLEKLLSEYHQDVIVSITERVQEKQNVVENLEKIGRLQEISEDNQLEIDRIIFDQKRMTQDIARFKDYRERSAKRFHQIEKKVNRLELDREDDDKIMKTIKQNFTTFGNILVTIYNQTGSFSYNLTELENGIQKIANNLTELENGIQIVTSNIDEKLSNVTTMCSNLVAACCDNSANQKVSGTANQTSDSKLTNQNSGNKTLASNIIPIIELGSGHDLSDPFLSKLEEESNQVDISSGDTDPDFGSGELGSGDLDETMTDLTNVVSVQEFLQQIQLRDDKILNLETRLSNLTSYMNSIEQRVSSIQLGNFMQMLQESVINFTQNVITIDQWRHASSNIVNSTLHNQDQIIQLTNRILGNTDKLADMRWQLNEAKSLSLQQFNILRMIVIKLNNTVQDMKEQMVKPKGLLFPTYLTNITLDNSTVSTIISRLDDLGLQIIYNQNRLGALEVKALNQSLSECRKSNMDWEQNARFVDHQEMIIKNTESILLIKEIVDHIGQGLTQVQTDNRNLTRRVRRIGSDCRKLEALVPEVVRMNTEVRHFREQLPIDCTEYHKRGYNDSGVYVIHPAGARQSVQVFCDMSSDGPWTVIQRRINGTVDFKQSWSRYRDGFGLPAGEYWLGNNHIHLLTTNNNYSLSIKVVDIFDNIWIANYSIFNVSSEDTKFTLFVKGYQGNATDALTYSSGNKFSTADYDNDASSTHCAFYYEAGWWYKHCQMCNLNGRYDIGIVWFDSEYGDWIQLKYSTMRIRRK